MDRTLKIMMLGLGILVVCHAASINVTKNGDQGKNVNLRLSLLTRLTLGNVDMKISGLGTKMNLKTTGLDLGLETNVDLKTTGLDSAMGTNVDSKTTGLDKNCSLGTTGLDLGTQVSCTHPFQKVGRKCYYFGGQTITFSEAAKKCFELDSTLAAPVKSKAENTELYNAMLKAQKTIKPDVGENWWHKGYWIGGFNLDKGKNWQWYTGQPITYKPWCNGPGHEQQPDNPSGETCLHVTGKLSSPSCWNDLGCTQRRHFVCQRH